MNHLAHCFLSLGAEDVLIGNFIGDFVKGNDWREYPPGVQKGILLHRRIDSFTDNHDMTNRSVNRIRPYTGRYAPPFVDILYDHFLAKNWSKYSDEKLENYADNFYKLLEGNKNILTDRIISMMPYMIARNWFVSYATISGMKMILFQMDYKTKHRVNMQEAIVELQDFYVEFESEFFLFFEELILSCQHKLAELNEV
jgi:acyl carrier protein phosphodiesterase